MRKIIFLFALLLLPIVVVLFLHGFGENKYAIPVYYSNAADMSSDLCQFGEGQHHIPPFSLTDQHNAAVGKEWLEGKLTVVDFIFTNCPDICKSMSTEMLRVQEAFRDDAQMQLLSFTVDPAFDTPAVLKGYAERLGAKEHNWKFVTGDKASIYRLARCGFLLPVQEGDGGPTDFIHTSKLVLVDGKGRIRGYYDGLDREEVDRLIQEIRILKTESNG